MLDANVGHSLPPILGQYWTNIGPIYNYTLGHAWLPILGQHCANAVALYWANEQTALGLCWMPMLAHHCCQYGPILDQYWLILDQYWIGILPSVFSVCVCLSVCPRHITNKAIRDSKYPPQPPHASVWQRSSH